jgi:hypothetical protein
MPLIGLESILRPGLHFCHRFRQHNVCSTFFVSWRNTETRWFSVALYGLLIFYGLTKDELKGRRPLAKFLAIKLIVFFTFYQAFVVSCESACDEILFSEFPKVRYAGGACDPWFVLYNPFRSPLNPLPATRYWTEANIADGLTALATCIEASPLVFSLLY